MSGGVSSVAKPNASVQVVLSGATVGINIGSTQVFSLSGLAAFTISGTEGFKLQSFTLNGFDVRRARLRRPPESRRNSRPLISRSRSPGSCSTRPRSTDCTILT